MNELNNAAYYGLFMGTLVLMFFSYSMITVPEVHHYIFFTLLTMILVFVAGIWYMVREIYKKLDDKN